METPNNAAGRLTEKVMEKVREKLPKIETHEYNRTYEAVYSVLHTMLGNTDRDTVELIAKAMDGIAFVRYKAGDVLPRGEEMSTPEKVNEIQGFRQRAVESQARRALRALGLIP